MSDDDPLATLTRSGSSEPSEPEPRARLRAVHPASLRWSAELPRETARIGRIEAPNIALAVAHGTVSRRHLELRWDGIMKRHMARDLGSHNGSRLDGEALGSTAMPLADGSVLLLGDVCLVYESIPPSLDPAAPASADATIPGDCPAMVALREAMARAAADPSPVLLLGETGTGKEHIARALHRQSGRRGPLVAVNCSALSPSLVDSQLFGHVKGAFTGATHEQPGLFRAAKGGTLFLDEIGDLPLALQPKLLRAIQEREIQPVGSNATVPVDVKIVAATHADLEDRVRAGEFRRDLYARLTLWQLRIPALRERRGDLLTWLERLHTQWIDQRPEHPVDTLTLATEAVETLLLHPWPNNLRELDRLVHELASAPHLTRPIERGRLPTWLLEAEPAAPSNRPITAEVGGPAPQVLRTPVPSREDFIAAFERLEGNVRALARHFDRDRRQIYRWIESHGLSGRRSARE